MVASSARGRSAAPQLRIRKSLTEGIAAGIDRDDPDSLGRWVGEQLRAAGFPRGKITLVIGREHVALRRLTLPTTEASELPSMTRLAMQRDLPFDAESAVIDFVPVDLGESSTTVLAVAVKQQVIDHWTALCRAAGLTVERIALRAMGAMSVAASAPAEESITQSSDAAARSALVIDIRSDGIEFSVMERGTVRTSRPAEVPPPQDRLAIVEAVVTEARRTWMSARVETGGTGNGGTRILPVSSSSTEPNRVILMGDQRVCEYAAEPLQQMLGVPVQVIHQHHQIIWPEVDAIQPDEHHWSLAGALLESAVRKETIDLAHPRREPDIAGANRRRRLLAVGAAVVLIGVVWTVARLNLQSLQREATQLVQEQRNQVPSIARYWRDYYKLEHLTHWQGTSTDWLDHAAYLTEIAPPQELLVLDKWDGTLNVRAILCNKTTGKWSVEQDLTIVIDGEARDRETADAFRAALVQSNVYSTATPGADAKGGKRMPFGFTYRLKGKDVASPLHPEVQPATAGARADGGGPS